MFNQFIYEENACIRLSDGVNRLAEILKNTYGPSGSQIVLGNPMSVPISVRSGNGIIQEINLQNPGTELAKEAVIKMADTEGDGTTTAVILLQKLTEDALRLTIAGMNPVKLRKALSEEADRTCIWLRNHAKMTSNVKEAAALAASSDAETRNMICEAFKMVKEDGIVTVRDTKGRESYVEVLDCVEIDQGYLLEEMLTNPAESEAVLENPHVLLTDLVISQSEDIVTAMNLSKKAGRPLFIMASDITGEALATLAVNIRNGKLRTLAVKATAYGERRKEILQDLAVATGAIVVSEDFGDSLRRVTEAHVGAAETIKSRRGHTYIYGGKGNPEVVKQRADRIRAEIKTSEYEVDRVNLKNRLARLMGGIAVIYVGAPTETEMRTKRQKIKSTVAAVKSILKHGAAPGGGIAMFDAAKVLYGKEMKEGTEEEQAARRLFGDMLKAPLKQLLKNAGYAPCEVMEELEKRPLGNGLDVVSGNYGDMYSLGIADGTGTICRAVEIAASLTGMIITAGAIAEKET